MAAEDERPAMGEGGELPSPVVIGVAGAIGAGKSSVARLLSERGCLWIDFDAEAKAALGRADVKAALVEAFGDSVLTPAGAVDTAALAGIVFADEDARRQLESITHPIVWRTREQARTEARAAGAWGVVLDAALLFEVGLDAECDVVVFVDAPPETRRRRVRERRGWDESELTRREAAQLSAAEKRSRSAAVVENSGSVEELAARVDELSAMLQERPR